MKLITIVVFLIAFLPGLQGQSALKNIAFEICLVDLEVYSIQLYPGYEINSFFNLVEIEKTSSVIYSATHIDYDYSLELGFFCKFEDWISRKSRFKIDLGLTSD